MHEKPRHRHIVIAGMSFTGSTLLSGLFNHVPGVLGIGEAHWIVDDPHRSGCTYCGPSCPVLMRLDTRNLTDANLYGRVADAGGAGTLVTSDKSQNLIDRFLPDGVADVLVVFKRPEAFASSNHRHQHVWGHRMDPEAFADWYINQLAWARSWAKSVTIVEYEQLAGNPDVYFPALCEHLRLRNPPKPPITFPPPNYHNVAGNINCYKSIRYRDRPIILDERWRNDLSDDELNGIRNSRKAMRVWRELLQKQAFRPPAG